VGALTRRAVSWPRGAQGGFLSILYSIGSKPLQIWDKQVQNGHIKRLTDEDIQSSVLEIMGTNVRDAARAAAAPARARVQNARMRPETLAPLRFGQCAFARRLRRCPPRTSPAPRTRARRWASRCRSW
jgi:hypothetical protein